MQSYIGLVNQYKIEMLVNQQAKHVKFLVITKMKWAQRWSNVDQNYLSKVPVNTVIFCWLGNVSGLILCTTHFGNQILAHVEKSLKPSYVYNTVPLSFGSWNQSYVSHSKLVDDSRDSHCFIMYWLIACLALQCSGENTKIA